MIHMSVHEWTRVSAILFCFYYFFFIYNFILLYFILKGKLTAAKWMALETLESMKFSSVSDVWVLIKVVISTLEQPGSVEKNCLFKVYHLKVVSFFNRSWSFGILLWEIETGGNLKRLCMFVIAYVDQIIYVYDISWGRCFCDPPKGFHVDDADLVRPVLIGCYLKCARKFETKQGTSQTSAFGHGSQKFRF